MGKRIIQRARGKGSLTYRVPSHRYKAAIAYPSYSEKLLKGQVIKFLHDAIHSAPIAKIKLESGEVFYNVASSQMYEGQSVLLGNDAEIIEGNVLPLSQIPEGTSVYNVEIQPGDGGRLCRGSGSFARVVRRINGKIVVLLPSKEEKIINGRARATIGSAAGTGRREKPIVKAGKAWHIMHARGKLYPRTSAVAMNAVDHPFGSGRGKNVGKPKTPSRFAPPGRKVGLLRARRTGRRKKK